MPEVISNRDPDVYTGGVSSNDHQLSVDECSPSVSLNISPKLIVVYGLGRAVLPAV